MVQAALVDTGTLTVKGTWSTPPETQGGKFRGAAVGSTAGFSYGAQVVEVEVDEDTGAVRVLQVWSAHDCGRALNPLAVQGQVQGAVWMGLGQALGEETQYHEGLPLRANFIDYRIPTSVESPPIDVTLVESIDPLGPFGAKEASEGGLHGVPPALAAAVHDATGCACTRCRSRPTACSRRCSRRQRDERLAAARARSAPQRPPTTEAEQRCDRYPNSSCCARPRWSRRRACCSAPAPGWWPAAPTCCPTCGAACSTRAA